MDDYSAIKTHVAKYIQLTEEETSFFISVLQITRVRKKQFIVQPGFVARCRNYVVKGALRTHFIDAKGQDHTIQLAIEDWWLGDFNSYIFQQPATQFVEALEDSTILQLGYESEQLLYERVPKFEKFFRIMAQRGLAFLQRRMLNNLSMTAKERYDEFLQVYPNIANRIPQYILASYLGISTEFLSKIRNKRVKKS